MGVNEQLIVMIGIDVGQDAYNDFSNAEEGNEDRLEEEDVDNKKPGECAIIYDGMSGEYCMVGIVVFASDRYGPIEGLGRLKIAHPSSEAIALIKKYAKEKLGLDIQSIDICGNVFMHYT